MTDRFIQKHINIATERNRYEQLIINMIQKALRDNAWEEHGCSGKIAVFRNLIESGFSKNELIHFGFDEKYVNANWYEKH